MDQLEIQAVMDHEAELEKRRQEQDAALDQERVEQVFGLTGGELETNPWEVKEVQTPTDPTAHTISGTHAYKYWYEGVPDYLGRREFPDLYDVPYRTIVTCCLFGGPPEVLEDEDGQWYRVASYSSSGEAPCSWEGCEDAEDHLPCKVCEGDEEHGRVYLGDGWAEVVYKQDPVREVLES